MMEDSDVIVRVVTQELELQEIAQMSMNVQRLLLRATQMPIATTLWVDTLVPANLDILEMEHIVLMSTNVQKQLHHVELVSIVQI
jgi:hypothetical protein